MTLKGACTGPAAVSLVPHALAPVADLPVTGVVSATHLVADLALDLGKVVHNYLAREFVNECPSGTKLPEKCER